MKKNLCTKNTLSTSRFGDFFLIGQNGLWVSRDLVRGIELKKTVKSHTPTLGQ